MLTFTLDTNCLVAVDEGRPEAAAVRILAEAHVRGCADVAIVAISASERQRDGKMLDNFSQFRGTRGITQSFPLAPHTPDMLLGRDVLGCVRRSPNREWPNSNRRFSEFSFLQSRPRGLTTVKCTGLDSEATPLDKKWKNAKCDVRPFGATRRKGETFSSPRTRTFTERQRTKLLAIAAGCIEYPDAAALLVSVRRSGEMGSGVLFYSSEIPGTPYLISSKKIRALQNAAFRDMAKLVESLAPASPGRFNSP